MNSIIHLSFFLDSFMNVVAYAILGILLAFWFITLIASIVRTYKEEKRKEQDEEADD